MSGRMSVLAVLLAGLAHAAANEEGSVTGERVVIRKVGYPLHLVGQRGACGQRAVQKGGLNPDYFLHVVFGGFHEGNCSAIGYEQFEESTHVSERPIPLLPRHNISFDVYSRDPTTVDVAGCIGRECHQEMSALGASPYLKDVAHCISPAFGPCQPKAWRCLGDEVCRSALECGPRVAKTCGKDVWKVVTNPDERKKVTCIWQCGNSSSCILEKCGKVALECFLGSDPLCHKAAVCLPEELLKCSAPALNCFLDKDGICRDNLACLARGASICADPAVNTLTDKSIAGLVTCANERCPAPGAVPVSPPLQFDAPEHYPEQLACMGLHCAVEVSNFVGDKDVGAVSSCLAEGFEGCSDKLWACLGDRTCSKEVRCWVDSAAADSSAVWKMVTDPHERSFDTELVTCVSDCSKHKGALAKAFCVAGTCGPQALKCFADSTCRGVFTDLPEAVLKCGSRSLKDPKFMESAKCFARAADSCGRAGIELARDENLAKLIGCNAQCTREPHQTALVV